MIRRALPLLLALMAGAAASASAQAGTCNLIDSQQVDRDPLSGLIQIQGPFLVRCEGGAELRAQHGTLNEFLRELVLTGDVFFQDPDQTLTADNATYSSGIGRLYATGNVVFTNRKEGSTIRGPELEYFRPMEGRPEAMVNAGQRPHLTLRPKDRAEDAEPLELDADRVQIQGQTHLSAYGNVEIEQAGMDASAREAQYNADTGELVLRGDARIENDRFALEGEIVEAALVEGVLQNVHARNDAALRGEELTVTAPDLRMFFTGERLQRAVARRGGEEGDRPVAVARNFRLEADSIDAITPDQRLDQVIAIGEARGEAIDTTRADSATAAPEVLAAADSTTAPADSAAAPDSAAVAALALIDRDWIVGDTLIGFFAAPDSATPADTAGADTAAVLKRIVARGFAQSLYRVQAQDSTGQPTPRRGVNYLAGETIELTFERGELNVAEVTGMRRGLYLDPAVGGATTPAASQPAATNPSATPRREGADAG
jgi:lipopolysaccharide export system protein LptA